MAHCPTACMSKQNHTKKHLPEKCKPYSAFKLLSMKKLSMNSEFLLQRDSAVTEKLKLGLISVNCMSGYCRLDRFDLTSLRTSTQKTWQAQHVRLLQVGQIRFDEPTYLYSENMASANSFEDL